MVASFSCTAPQFTDEDLLREKESLTPEERVEIEKDISGDAPSFVETAEMKDQGLIFLQEALDAMDPTEKQTYLEALDTCPKIVQKESNPLFFLRAEKYDAWAAARRLCKYWTLRKKLFGERAFCRMDQSPDGAITEWDLRFIRRGIFCHLPKDRNKRGVLYYEKARINYNEYDRMAISRSCFYACHMCQEDEDVLKNGAVVIVNLKGFNPLKIDRLLMKYCTGMILNCFPYQIKAVHMSHTGSKTVMSLAVPVIHHVVGKRTRQRTILHVARSDVEIRRSYEGFGFDADGLPTTLGGNWSFKTLPDKLEERRELEMKRINFDGEEPPY